MVSFPLRIVSCSHSWGWCLFFSLISFPTRTSMFSSISVFWILSEPRKTQKFQSKPFLKLTGPSHPQWRRAPWRDMFYMSPFSVLCSVLLELLGGHGAVRAKAWQIASGVSGAVDGWCGNQLPSWSNGMGSLFVFFLENCGKPGKVSYVLFSKLVCSPLFSPCLPPLSPPYLSVFFFFSRLLYDSHAKARIMLGWIYFKYQRSIFTYCILESSRWKCVTVGVSHAGRGTWRLFCVGFYLNMCLFWIMLPWAKLSRCLYFYIESQNWNIQTI